MISQRWLRIIPVALLMYTISYVDRTNVSLALDPSISTMMKELFMDDRMKGEAAGIFFFGYVLLQMPGGYLASRWSPRKLISLFLIAWGACAVGCGLAQSFRHFEVMRFLLGVAESGVFPATLVLLANWFPRSERARANALWNLCQPLAVAGSAPLTGWLLGRYGWHQMLLLEGLLPFLWLPVWWFGIRDHPSQVKWLPVPERESLEAALRTEQAQLETAAEADSTSLPTAATAAPAGRNLRVLPALLVMVCIYFLHNCAAYGCMTFFTNGLKGRGFSPVQYGVLFAVPYIVTAVIMVVNSWHSDKTHERRGHVAAVYILSGTSLLLSVALQSHFWLSYGFLCLAIPGPFAAMAPFWVIPSETMPRRMTGLVIGLVNAVGNLGGFAGPYISGWLSQIYKGTAVAFNVLGLGMLVAAGLAFLLPVARTDATLPGHRRAQSSVSSLPVQE